MRKFSYFPLLALLAFCSCKESFKKGDDGLEYKIIKDGKGETIKYGNLMQIHVGQYYNNGKIDSLISDTRSGIAIIEALDTLRTPPAYFKILSQMRKGDSVVIRILADSMFKTSPESMPPFIKKGHMLLTTVKMVDFFETQEQADKARDADIKIATARQETKDVQQLKKDDETIKDYLSKNKITAVKAPQGTYVQIIQPGTGANVDTSVVAKVNYTGQLMTGKLFDSNTDSAFGHVSPLYVNMTNDPSLGQGVIKGWYDGLSMLNKGAKARFFIPSPLAYSSAGRQPHIAPDEILIFDMEVLDILNKETARKVIQEEMRKMQEAQIRQQMEMQMQQQQGQGQ